MNKWTGIGRLTRDPELRYGQSGVAVATFTIAVDRRFKNAQGEKETDFIQVKAFKQLAELCSNYLSKGKLAGVTGELHINNYTDNDGNKKWTTEINADEVDFLSPKSEGTGAQQGQSAQNQQPQAQYTPPPYQPPQQQPQYGQQPSYPGQFAPPGYQPQPQQQTYGQAPQGQWQAPPSGQQTPPPPGYHPNMPNPNFPPPQSQQQHPLWLGQTPQNQPSNGQQLNLDQIGKQVNIPSDEIPF